MSFGEIHSVYYTLIQSTNWHSSVSIVLSLSHYSHGQNFFVDHIKLIAFPPICILISFFLINFHGHNFANLNLFSCLSLFRVNF